MKPPYTSGARRQFAILSAIAVAIASTYLYFNLFTAAGVPREVGFDDDKVFLGEAMRLLRGERMYRDFFEFYVPGTDVFYALVMRIFGVRAWIPNVCLLPMGITFVWLSIIISRRLILGAAAVLPGLMFLVLSFHGYLDAAPHWYSNLIIVAAIAVLIDETTRFTLIIAGILTGLAACFAQSHGTFAALGIAGFIYWEARTDKRDAGEVVHRELQFIIPVGLTVVGLLSYFAFEAGIGNFLYCTVLFPIKYWRSAPPARWTQYFFLNLRAYSAAHHFRVFRALTMALLVPAVYFVAAVQSRRREAKSTNPALRAIALLVAVGLSTFASIASSAAYHRMATVSLPALILFVWLISRNFGTRTIFVVYALTLAAMLEDLALANLKPLSYFDSPSGRVAVSSSVRLSYYVSYYDWWLHNTRPGEYVFAPMNYDLYFWFHLRNPTKLFQLNPSDFSRPEQVSEAVRDLAAHKPRLILWSSYLDEENGRPALERFQPIRDYMNSHYRVLKTMGAESDYVETVWEWTEDGKK